MSYSETSDGFEFECDKCHKVFTPPKMGLGSEKPDFVFCLELAKKKGWRPYKHTSKDGRVTQWRHKCPSC